MAMLKEAEESTQMTPNEPIDFGPPKPIEGHLLLVSSKKGRSKSTPYYFMLRGPSITYYKDQWSIDKRLGTIRLDGIEIRIIHDARHLGAAAPTSAPSETKKKSRRRSIKMLKVKLFHSSSTNSC